MLTTPLDSAWHAVASERDLPQPGTYLLADVADEQAIVVRGRDGVVRAFHNACKHRGSRVLDQPCGSVVRLQCIYHAWVYDLDGSLVRAKHTDDLTAFDHGDHGLTPIDVMVADGAISLRLDELPRATGPLTAAELGAVRRPYRSASLLPGRAYHDEAIFEHERARWFARDWLCVGRVGDVDVARLARDAARLCELQQQGTGSRGFRAGRFANNEPSVHAFDQLCADRYLGDAFVSMRTVRNRYDVPPPLEHTKTGSLRATVR